VCDLAYTVMVERLEADVRAAQQAAILVAALGGKPDWLELDDQIAVLDDHLASAPKTVDREEAELRDALGLRRPGG
jgi:hypothetical protein